MEKFKKIIKEILKYRDIVFVGCLVVLIMVLANKCSSNNELKKELKRQQNNELAMKDTLTSYIDKLGRANAEKHAYQLTQKEILDSLGEKNRKNMEYITYLKTQLGIKDTVELLCYIDRPYRDTSMLDNGIIRFDTSSVFGKSARKLSVMIPYGIDTMLHLGKGSFALEQNIFFEGWLERNTKTGETYVHLRSDYPGIGFNSGEGFVAEQSKQYDISMRKRLGLGLFVGPSVGFGYAPKGWQPYVGLSVGFGLTFTPRRLQW